MRTHGSSTVPLYSQMYASTEGHVTPLQILNSNLIVEINVIQLNLYIDLYMA